MTKLWSRCSSVVLSNGQTYVVGSSPSRVRVQFTPQQANPGPANVFLDSDTSGGLIGFTYYNSNDYPTFDTARHGDLPQRRFVIKGDSPFNPSGVGIVETFQGG